MSDKKKKIKKKIIKSKSKLPKLNTTGTEGDDSNNQNRLRFGQIRDISLSGEITAFGVPAPTGLIAYKLFRDQLLPLIDGSSVNQINEIINDQGNDKYEAITTKFGTNPIEENALLGLIFDFKNSQTQDLEHIKIYQLFYINSVIEVDNTSTPIKGLVKYPFNDEPIYVLGETHANTEFNIMETPKPARINEPIEKAYNLGNRRNSFVRPGSNWIEEDEPMKYKKLHFYNEQIATVDFVFFTRDQLSVLVEFFESYVITGIQMNLGLKVGSIDPDKVLLDHYFNLKIEGEDSPHISDNIGESGALLPGIMVGIPCPDVWFILGVLFTEARRIDPKVKIEEFTKSLEDLITPLR